MLRRKRHPARPQLPLFVQSSDETGLALADLPRSPPVTTQTAADSRLWLCLAVPDLALEALHLSSPGQTAKAHAVTTEVGSRRVVYQRDSRAAEAGIAPGMALNAALALCPELRIDVRDEAAESLRLQELAQYALEFTSLVCIDTRGALLLEVAGSLRLFGGLDALLDAASKPFAAAGCRIEMAVATTATAALWLAHSECGWSHSSGSGATVPLRRLLSCLPIEVTGWPAATQQRLHRMGINTVGDCLRMPREGFARRTSPDCLRQLDRALGRSPELFRYYQPPVVFHDRLGFASEVTELEGVLQAAAELLARLGEFLRRRQLSAVTLVLHMEHHGRPPTCVELKLREPAHTTNHVQELVTLQLDRHTLAAPVLGLCMDAQTAPLHARPSAELPIAGRQQVAATDNRVVRLTERLRARLGGTSVHGLELRAEHRPEKAWRSTDVLLPARSDSYAAAGRKRPLWLLPTPRRLQVRENQPSYRGRLDLLSDAERIESGWWDGQGIRRDYFVATSSQGRRWWIYRDQSHWYLHGIFS